MVQRLLGFASRSRDNTYIRAWKLAYPITVTSRCTPAIPRCGLSTLSKRAWRYLIFSSSNSRPEHTAAHKTPWSHGTLCLSISHCMPTTAASRSDVGLPGTPSTAAPWFSSTSTVPRLPALTASNISFSLSSAPASRSCRTKPRLQTPDKPGAHCGRQSPPR